MPAAPHPRTSRSDAHVVVVGAGPRALSFLERLAASTAELLGDRRLVVHVVDPHPPGAGRIWRREQSSLLWMNSVTEDVTLFTDESVPMDGPLNPGPSLWEWIRDHAGAVALEAHVAAEVADAGPRTFASRRLQSDYLAWVLDRVLAEAPESVDVRFHTARAVDVLRQSSDASAPGERVVLDDGSVLLADAVVLTQGHLDVEVPLGEQAHADFAARHGLVHVGTGYTADLDLDALAPGEDVLVRGFGLAFVDLAVLVTQGRGGRFVGRDGGGLQYVPSGLEPRLVVGSRRGVPYRSKLGYSAPGPLPALPRRVTADVVRLVTGGEPVTSFEGQLWPLIAHDLGHAHYSELFRAHPERVTTTWDEFEPAYDATLWGSDAQRDLVDWAVPKAEDRLDLTALDRPLLDVTVGDVSDLQLQVREHVRNDLDRRHDPHHSADAAVFIGLLQTYGALGALAAEGLLSPRVLVEGIEGRWHNFFSYVASGPPGIRLEQLLALSDAGIVTFLGADVEIATDEDLGAFVGRSSSHPTTMTARALVEARLPDPSVHGSADPLVRALASRGEISDDSTTDHAGSVTSGKVRARPRDQRLLEQDGYAAPARFALGPWVSGGAATAAFARPRVGAGFFRQNDAVARQVLLYVAETVR
jgi:uncharacterized NAD(P)/FAD-binding protein YdhS